MKRKAIAILKVGGGYEAPHQSNSATTQNETNTAVDSSKGNGVVPGGIYPAIERELLIYVNSLITVYSEAGPFE